VSTPTKDRILDAAISLFGERGFKGTSVADIEAAAGLSPGAGGMFHHFKSKQAVLEAGIDRHLARLDAMRDIRRIVGDIGDVETQLTIMARYVLSELDAEAALVRLLVVEARNQPSLGRVVDELMSASQADFSGWIMNHSSLDAAQADLVATLAIGSLAAPRLTAAVLGGQVLPIDDATFVPAWVRSVRLMIEGASEG
jgi:AcrR family transcriptional regulator